MKQLKVLALATISALLMLFVVFVPMRANAATIENGKSVKLLKEGKQFYKFTLEDDSVLKVSWSKNNNQLMYMYIYTDKNRSNCVYGFGPSQVSGNYYICLKKGTYYADMFDGNSSKAAQATMKFTWESGKKYSRGNYSLATAYSLKSGTIESIAQIRKYSYTRWYKIKLTKTQKITLQIPYGDYSQFALFNSDCERLYLNSSNYTYGIDKSVYTDDKLPAGTYYISVFLSNPAESYGPYYAFKWK